MIGYHVTITMPGGSCGQHADLYHDGAAAAERAIDLFPQAARIQVLRLSTVLAGSPMRQVAQPAGQQGAQR